MLSLLLVFNKNIFKFFSASMSDTVNINWYNSHKQKDYGVLNTKECDQHDEELLFQCRAKEGRKEGTTPNCL